MSDYQYTIFLDPDPETGAYTVTVPALPGCITQGDTLEEAIAMAKESISLHIEGLLADGLPVPRETERPQAITVSVAVEPAAATST
jgi:predicted RNase H-like HicB family nuclease